MSKKSRLTKLKCDESGDPVAVWDQGTDDDDAAFCMLEDGEEATEHIKRMVILWNRLANVETKDLEKLDLHKMLVNLRKLKDQMGVLVGKNLSIPDRKITAQINLILADLYSLDHIEQYEAHEKSEEERVSKQRRVVYRGE